MLRVYLEPSGLVGYQHPHMMGNNGQEITQEWANKGEMNEGDQIKLMEEGKRKGGEEDGGEGVEENKVRVD